MYLDDMRLLRLEKSEYLIPAEDVASFERLLKRRRYPVDYHIGEIPPPRDKFAAEREAEIERAVSRMPYDDGDALPEGHYVVNEDGGLVRTGPAEAKVSWHGTSAPTDTFFHLEPRAPMADGREHLQKVPGIYTTKPLIAQDIAFDEWRKQRDEGRGNEQSPQMYGLVTTPSETVALGDCTDEATVVEAINLGADVLECPDWKTRGGKYVPETVILNDDVHHTSRAWQFDVIPDASISKIAENAEQALLSDGKRAESIKRASGAPRHTKYKDLPVSPRRRKPKRHLYLRKGRG